MYGQIPYPLQANPLIIKGKAHNQKGKCPYLEETFLTIGKSLNLYGEFLLQDYPFTKVVKFSTGNSFTKFGHSHYG